MIVFYHNDPDGWASAAIIGHKFGFDRVKFYERDYNMILTWEDVRDMVSPGEPVWIVDYSLRENEMEILMHTTRDITWIDHHKTSISRVYAHPVKGLQNTNWCGAMLTWIYVNRGLRPGRALDLLDKYDTWKDGNNPIVQRFYFGLLARINTPTDELWEELMFSPTCDQAVDALITSGTSILKFMDLKYHEWRKSGFETELDGHQTFAMNIPRSGSVAFGPLLKHYPICLTFCYNGNSWTVSLYSSTIDVSEIAKKFGGGGHPGASGFVTEELSFLRKQSC